jgi:hypothetical protein
LRIDALKAARVSAPALGEDVYMGKVANQFFKANRFLGPLCLIAYLFIFFSKQKTTLTSAFVISFSVLLLIDGLFSLKFSKPSLSTGLQKIQSSELFDDEKVKRAITLNKLNIFFSGCSIVGALTIPIVWFLVM